MSSSSLLFHYYDIKFTQYSMIGPGIQYENATRTGEAASIPVEVDSSISGKKVATVINRVALFRGLPKEILTDNGSKFTGNAMNAWSHDRRVEYIFADPGRPTQNGYIESSNGKLREECLNQN